MLRQPMPFSLSRTASTFTPARPAWWASWPTRASDRFRICCGASRSRAQRARRCSPRFRCRLPSLEQGRPATDQPPGNNEMKQLQRVAFIGNHLPRRCGIATFTHDLHRAVATARPDLETCVVAMTDPGRTYDYPPAVRFQIRDEVIGDYVQAAEFLNNAGFDVVSLQHEYGIFGGEAGGNIVELLVPSRNADRDHASHRALPADAHPARRDAPDHRCFDEDRRHVGKRPRTPPFRS